MEKTVIQRLKEYLKAKKMGQNRFEKLAGISTGYIANVRNAPGADHLLKILNAAPDLNKVWLLTGDGEMLTSNATPAHVSDLEEYTETKNGLKFYKREDGQLVMKVPIVPIVALGSPEDEYAEIIRDSESGTVSISVDAVHHGRYVAFRIEGDSMDDGTRNSFEAGDIVVCRELSRDNWLPKLHIRDWPYWVIVFGNNVRIKEIVKQEGNFITCHSINPSPEYTDFKLNFNEISRLFNVVQKIPKTVFFG